MKQFSLDEYLKNPERKIVTREGRNVKIICTNYNSHHPIIAEIEGLECSESFTIEGKYYIMERDSQLDLLFATEKHEGWVNVHRQLDSDEIYCTCNVYNSEEEAIANRAETGIATIKIEWEEYL